MNIQGRIFEVLAAKASATAAVRVTPEFEQAVLALHGSRGKVLATVDPVFDGHARLLRAPRRSRTWGSRDHWPRRLPRRVLDQRQDARSPRDARTRTAHWPEDGHRGHLASGFRPSPAQRHRSGHGHNKRAVSARSHAVGEYGGHAGNRGCHRFGADGIEGLLQTRLRTATPWRLSRSRRSLGQ